MRPQPVKATPSPRRDIARPLLAALAIVCAAMCIAWTPNLPPTPATKPTSPELVAADAAAVRSAILAPGARLVLVNAWATWCPPCLDELPDILRAYRTYQPRGVRLVLISADFDASRGEAIAFLTDQGVDFRSYLKDGDDDAFIDGLNPDWSGALPATFVFDAEGKLLYFVEGPLTYQALDELLSGLLAVPDNASTP